MRKKNIENAFMLKKHFNYKNILITDDIITSGSTINEIANTLQSENSLLNLYIFTLAFAI